MTIQTHQTLQKRGLFSKHSFAEVKECQLKNRNLPKIGGCLPTYKEVFFWSVVWFCWWFCWWFCLLFLCAFVLLFCKKGPKRQFSSSFRVFFLFCSPKRPVFKSFFYSYSVFIFVFLLSSQSEFHFSLYFVHQLLFGKHSYFGVSFVVLFLAFSFPNVCLFLWNTLS